MKSLMIINLNHLKHNARIVQSYTKHPIIAIMKSDAYGLGIKPIVKSLTQAGVRFFACNTLKEAKEILTIKQVKVLILDSLELKTLFNIGNFEKIIISINSIQDVHNINQIKTPITVHLQIDTGMNRLGIRTLDEAKRVINLLKVNPLITIEGIYTHFSSNAKKLPSYESQNRLFQEYLKLYPFAIIHTANTPSLVKKIEGNYVRIGMALYGYHSDIPALKSVVQVYTKCCNIINLDEKDEVGYDGAFVTFQKATLGVLPFGYDDGELTPFIYYNNQKYRIVGKRCMNHTFVLIDQKINYISYLSLLPKNDKIYHGCNYYHLLTSMKKISKIYLTQVKYDIPSIIKRRNQASLRYSKRTRSN